MVSEFSHATVSAGSSEVRRGGATFLQLKLTVNNGEKNEDVFMGLPFIRDQIIPHACCDRADAPAILLDAA